MPKETQISPMYDTAHDVVQAALYVPTKPFIERSLGVELPSRLQVLGEAAYQAATLPVALAATAILRGKIKL